MKRKFLFGTSSLGVGLLLLGLGLSLNAQAAAVTIDAISISTTPTTQDSASAIINYSIPNDRFVLSQDPMVTVDPHTNKIQIDLYFVPPGQAPQSAVTQTLAATNSITAGLGTLLAGSYDITATAYFQNSANSLTTTMKMPTVPIPAALWLLLSGLAPLLIVGRRKSRA